MAQAVAERDDRRLGGGGPDQRDLFAQDRDRILYSTALRRLAGVTQVVGAAEGHVFHNRLTHTLEVAQLARRLAENFLEAQPELSAELGIHPEVTECAALAHDLGHPPFGHVAESELDRLVVGLGVEDGFEGNAQTFRVVTKLSVRYANRLGQNLTRATLNAILKYPWQRQPGGFKHRKYGAYTSEQADFDWARRLQTEITQEEKSAEAEIMDWADDIAYAVHDVEDFFRARFIPLDRLMKDEGEEVSQFVEGTFRRWDLEGFRPVRETVTNEQLRTGFENLIEQLRETQPITEPYAGRRDQRANLRALTSLLISRYVPELTLKEPIAEAPRSVAIQPVAEREITMLKQLAWFYVIQRPSLAGQQLGQRRIIADLFRIFYEATENVRSRDLLPVGAREFLEHQLDAGGQDVNHVRARVATDVICSLSEQQAIDMHQRVTGTNGGSVLQVITP